MTDERTPDLLAAEYAIGLLDADERAEAARRADSDAGFALLVAQWNERLMPLFDRIPPAAPSPELWERIAAALEASEASEAPASNVVALRRRVTLWRGYAAAITAVAASLALVVGLDMTKGPPVRELPAAAPVLVAAVAAEEGPVALTASYDPASRSLLVVPAALEAVAGQDHELWLIPASGTPHSLGLVFAGRPGRVAIPSALQAALAESATLAVSAEPSGGSPTGQPTGPVVATGILTRI